jgi:hypothetical protein
VVTLIISSKAAGVLHAQMPKEVAMTVLLCVFLETDWASEKGMWSIIVEKAWNYVIGAVGEEAIDKSRKGIIS